MLSRWALFVLVVVSSVAVHVSEERVVSSVGDSLTWGLGSSKHHTTTYPAVLQRLLTAAFPQHQWTVKNFGDNGKTALKGTGKNSYWHTNAYRNSKRTMAPYVILQLGTNDAKKSNWNETSFRRDYLALMREYLNMPMKPLLFVCIPPPLYSDDGRPRGFPFGINPQVVNGVLPSVVPDLVAVANNLTGRCVTGAPGLGLSLSLTRVCRLVCSRDAGCGWWTTSVCWGAARCTPTSPSPTRCVYCLFGPYLGPPSILI